MPGAEIDQRILAQYGNSALLYRSTNTRVWNGDTPTLPVKNSTKLNCQKEK